jgi:hypothetical protein
MESQIQKLVGMAHAIHFALNAKKLATLDAFSQMIRNTIAL